MHHAVAALDHIQDAAVVDLVLEMSCNIDYSSIRSNDNNNNAQPVQQQRVQDHEDIIQWPYIEIVDVIDWRQGASRTNRRVLVQQRITFNICVQQGVFSDVNLCTRRIRLDLRDWAQLTVSEARAAYMEDRMHHLFAHVC